MKMKCSDAVEILIELATIELLILQDSNIVVSEAVDVKASDIPFQSPFLHPWRRHDCLCNRPDALKVSRG